MDSRKTAIVTGAASGLGRAIAVELARCNWRVALADVDQQGSHETLDLVHAAGGEAQVESLDVTRADEWCALRERLQPTWPTLDLLVNNAGVGMGGDFDQRPLDDWRWIVDINLMGAINGCHTMIDWLKQNPQGAHLVNIASLAAIASAPGMAAYNITKAGIVSLSETLYGELKPFGVGVSVVCPYFVPTNILRNGRFSSEAELKLADWLMSRSRTTAEDVARGVLRAIDRKQLYVFDSLYGRVVWRLKRLMPRTFLSLVSRRRAKEMTAAANAMNGERS